MANEFNEPEELSGEQGYDYDPMGAPINEKPYTKPNVKINPKDLQADIPEASFQAPLIDLDKPPIAEVPPTPKKEREPFNKEMNELPKKEKELAAHHVANMLMQVYEGMNVLASKAMVFNEKKLNKLQADGEIDFTIRVPYDYKSNDTITAAELIGEFNRQHENAFVVTKEFKEEVTPILERVLRKRGVGMTDEQMLIFLFGKDIALKGGEYLKARAQMSSIIEQLKEQTLEMKNGNFRSQMQTPPPPQPTPQPTPQPSEYNPNPVILGTDEPIDESEEEDNYVENYFDEEEEDESQVIGSVQEQVEAQLQRKTVAQLRKEQIAMAKANLKGRKVTSGKRGRKKK
jgi:hypothetical protein